MLHRISCWVYDPINNRMKREFSPWHPDFDYVESVAKSMYRSFKVTFETIRDPFQEERLVDYVLPPANMTGFKNGEPVITLPEIDDDIYSPTHGQRFRDYDPDIDGDRDTPKFDYIPPDLSAFLPAKNYLSPAPAVAAKMVAKVVQKIEVKALPNPVDIPVPVVKVSRGTHAVNKTPFSLAELEESDLPSVETIQHPEDLLTTPIKAIEEPDSDFLDDLAEWGDMLDGI